jgi:photosystem II stability/assembly factor-like uncharacterized protein
MRMSGVFRTSDAGRNWVQLPGTKGWAVWSIALWPRDPGVIAAGTGSGVYLSRDAGASWKHISSDDNSDLRPVVSIAFHPSKSETIYAGTTHLPWRTTDAGASWHSIHTGMIDDSDVFSIQVDPLRPERVFASACSGVYSSSDGAERWSKSQTPRGAFRTYFVALDPKHEATVFAGTTEGLLKSTNDGRSWRKVSTEQIKSIAFDSWVAGRIFFASTTAGLMVSTDGGNTLRPSDFGFTNRNFTTLTGAGTVLYSSSVYEPSSSGLYRTANLGLRWARVGEPAADQLLHIAAAPDNPLMLFAAGYRSGLLESADGGKSWLKRDGPVSGSAPSALLPLGNGELLLAAGSGLFRSMDRVHWTRVSDAKVRILEAAGKNILAALGSAVALKSDDGGETWRPCGASGDSSSPAFYAMAFDSGDPSVALGATAAGLLRSNDGCQSWKRVTEGLDRATAALVLFHPTRPGEAYVVQSGRVFRSHDGGQGWELLEDERLGNSGPSSLLVLPSAPDRLFALFPRRGVFLISIGAAIAPRRLPGELSGKGAANE